MKKTVALRLGKNIRNARKLAKVSQHEIALETYMGLNYISHIELGKVNCSIQHVYKISKYLKVPIKELVKGI